MARVADDVEHTVLALDSERYRAMRDGDVGRLAALLSERLTYTHSTGVTESRDQYLAALSSGRVRYLQTAREVEHFAAWPGCAVMQGRLQVLAEVDGHRHAGCACFTSTWVEVDGRWSMAAWAATPRAQETR